MQQTINAAIEKAPGFLAAMHRYAEQVLKAKREYVDKHWGLEGPQGLIQTSYLNPADGPTVVMGEIVRVDYYTKKKGDDREGNIYYHDFKSPGPLLVFGDETAGRKGLAIVRGSSRYTVTRHGIVG